MTPREAKIVELYRQGLLLKAIAAEVGVAPNSVGQILRRLGYDRPHKPQRRHGGFPDQTEKILKLWNDGLCASQIAERTGESRQTVDAALKNQRGSGPARHRYDGSAPGGSGKDGFAGSMARKT